MKEWIKGRGTEWRDGRTFSLLIGRQPVGHLDLKTKSACAADKMPINVSLSLT